ncbi:unnamed protein product [Lactuca virosa]|uniref:Uncharacterized protein n=1 Tax=Lactuca virosa TaxID=75947 RepID=A0AAU9PPZ9_9ASTR|nr:unnamed protein product [Lactuca virosa]
MPIYTNQVCHVYSGKSTLSGRLLLFFLNPLDQGIGMRGPFRKAASVFLIKSYLLCTIIMRGPFSYDNLLLSRFLFAFLQTKMGEDLSGRDGMRISKADDTLYYYNKCLESEEIICLHKRMTIEAVDGLQKAQKVSDYSKLSAEGTITECINHCLIQVHLNANSDHKEETCIGCFIHSDQNWLKPLLGCDELWPRQHGIGYMLMNIFWGLGTGGFTMPNNSNELYATQLAQLQEMGFFDTRENRQALTATAVYDLYGCFSLEEEEQCICKLAVFKVPSIFEDTHLGG